MIQTKPFVVEIVCTMATDIAVVLHPTIMDLRDAATMTLALYTINIHMDVAMAKWYVFHLGSVIIITVAAMVFLITDTSISVAANASIQDLATLHAVVHKLTTTVHMVVAMLQGRYIRNYAVLIHAVVDILHTITTHTNVAVMVKLFQRTKIVHTINNFKHLQM